MPAQEIEWWISPLFKWKCLVCRQIGKSVTHRFLLHVQQNWHSRIWFNENFNLRIFSFKILWTAEFGLVKSERKRAFCWSINSWRLTIQYSLSQWILPIYGLRPIQNAQSSLRHWLLCTGIIFFNHSFSLSLVHNFLK